MFGTVAGYMPSYGAIHPILRWLSWLTPVSYAFEGLMINQFQNLPFDDSLLALGNGTVETVKTGGNIWLSAYDLPRIDFATEGCIKIFNICMLFVFAIFYDFIGQMLTERNRSWFFNQTRMPVSVVKQPFSMTIPKAVQLVAGSDVSRSKEDDEHEKNETIKADWPQSLVVKNLCYDVPLKGNMNCFKKMDDLESDEGIETEIAE